MNWVFFQKVLLGTSLSLTLAASSSCIPKFGKSNSLSKGGGTSFGVTIPIPEAIAARLGYSGIFQVTADSSSGKSRIFEQQVSFRGAQAGRIMLDKDSAGQATALESKATSDCSGSFCQSEFSNDTYSKCGGSAAVVFVEAI